MANYAQDSDLETYDSTISQQGVDSFEAQFTLATADVLNLIKGSWWPKATTIPLTSFDEDNLNIEQLKQLTVFKALYSYILPLLAKFLEGDVFNEKIKFYKDRFDEEWSVIQNLPLYDFDEDTSFEDSERRGPMTVRKSRG